MKLVKAIWKMQGLAELASATSFRRRLAAIQLQQSDARGSSHREGHGPGSCDTKDPGAGGENNDSLLVFTLFLDRHKESMTEREAQRDDERLPTDSVSLSIFRVEMRTP